MDWTWDAVLSQVLRWAFLVSMVLGIVLLIRVHFVLTRLIDWLLLYAPTVAPPVPAKPPDPEPPSPPPPPVMGCDFGVSGILPRAFR